MGALAERRYEHDGEAEHERSLVPLLREIGPDASDRAAEHHGQRWNVLATELLAYPTRAQRIWLEREDPAPGTHERQRHSPAAASRSYADEWLERELESLRRRRERGSALATAGRPTAAERSRQRAVEPRRRQDEIGDPATEPGAGLPAAGALPATGSPLRRARDGARLKPPARHGQAARRHATHTPAGVAKPGQRGLRRILPGAATLAVLAGTWFGVGALAGADHTSRIVPLPGSVPVAGGFAYVVKPGDTLWSIAARAEPGADPRALVDRLEAELGGRQLQPGDRLVVRR